jgi:hypothetical protein
MDLALKEREKIARDLLIANKVAKLNAEQTKSEKETENIKKKIKKDLETRELNAELINSGFLKPNDLIKEEPLVPSKPIRLEPLNIPFSRKSVKSSIQKDTKKNPKP